MTTNPNVPQAADTAKPGDLVEMYHRENLPQGSNPADHTAVTTREAFHTVWKDKGFSLLEDYTPTAEPPADVNIDPNQDEE